MGIFTEKILVPIFILGLKTRRIAKSAVHGKIHYHIKKYCPFVLGFAIAGWTAFTLLR